MGRLFSLLHMENRFQKLTNLSYFTAIFDLDKAMKFHTIDDVISSTDRYKLFVLLCKDRSVVEEIKYLANSKIKSVNIGYGIAEFVAYRTNAKYLNIDVQDHLKKLLDGGKTKLNNNVNDVVAIYNIGILLEPAIELNPAILFKEYSKSTALILIWENEIDSDNILSWETQKVEYNLDFKDAPLKILSYAV